MNCPDTGESAASINRRADDLAWSRVLPALQAGATLVRPSRLNRYYVDAGQGPSIGGLTATRVKKLETAGTLMRVGVDRYALAKAQEGAT